MEQLYYTSGERLADGQSGFGVLARSAGVTDTDVRAAGMYNRYHRPDRLGADAPITEFPVALSFHRGADGRCYLTRATYAGEDFSGRQGNFFAHTVVMTDEDLRGLSFAPVLAFDATLWVSGASDTAALPPLQPFPQVEPPRASAAAGYVEADDRRPTLLAEILQALIEAHTVHRRVLLIAPVTDVLTWLYLVSVCVPQKLRTNLTFSTYQRDPQDVNATLVGIDPEAGAQFSSTQYRVIDCASGEGLEGRIGTAAGLLSYLAVSGDDAKLTDINEFAETFGIESWAELDGLVSAWMAARSNLSEVSAEIVDAAGAFFSARATTHPAQAEAAVTTALNQLSGSGQDEVKRSVVRMAARVLVAPDQVERFKESLAKSISAALEEGASTWLRGDFGADPVCGAVVKAAAAMTDVTAWAPRMILRGDVQLLHDVWWVFDAAVRANQDPGDQVWKDVAALACSQGDQELGAALFETVAALSGQFPAYGRKVADFIAQPMIHTWPRDVVAFASRLLANADEELTPADAERLVWALERSPGKGSEITELLRELLDDQRKVRSFLMAVERSTKLREGVAQSAARLKGIEGTQLRHLMMTTPGCDALIELVRVLDMQTESPAGVIGLWVNGYGGRLTHEQMSIIEPIVEWVESRQSTAEDWRVLYEMRDRFGDDGGLSIRCIAGYMATRPLEPLDAAGRGALQDILPTVRAELRGRLELIGYLSWIEEVIKRKGRWPDVFSAGVMPLSRHVTEQDLREFLVALNRQVERGNLGKIVESDRDPTVRYLFASLGASEFGALCDGWFANVLASQKQDVATRAASNWIWEVAHTNADATRIEFFLNQLKPTVSRQVREEMRQIAARPPEGMSQRVLEMYWQAAGQKQGGFRFPMPGRRG